ncbi:MAG: molecular chaperone DjlA [Bacteroidetes bacterium RIFOXYC12_FULL_35_7]|nr:MAG: molecular chaperone DjlA [Bacteroidetes bacterium RIFOXYC12_FULL_35_7]
MAKFAKWIAGGLGWAFFGPIGGLLGFAIGTMIDGAQITNNQTTSVTTKGDFVVSLLVLVAAVMKADGKILKSELDYVKDYFVKSFGKQTAVEALRMLRELIGKNIPVEDVSNQIKTNLDYSSRLQLLHFLFGIANADGKLHPSELNLIDRITVTMGINSKDYESIKAMFAGDTRGAYKIMEIDPSASDDEVKKAYRKMALKYHPDKVSYLGEEVQAAANEKFKKLNEAYDVIKKERGMA